MKLVKVFSVLVATAGLALLAAAAAPSVYGHPSEQDRATEGSQRRGRELTVLAGRGAEIGASVRDVDGSDKARGGVVVEDVRPDTPAEKAGLKRSDVIVEFDGEAVRSARQFTRLVRETAPGRPVKATIVRDGARKDVEITPADGRDGLVIDSDRLRDRLGDLYERMPQFNFDFDLPFAFDGRGRLGVSVQELTPQLASYFGVKDGVLVTAVTDDAPASRAGLKAGDVITKIDNTTVGSREDLVRALREVKDGGETTIGIVRAKKELSVSVKLEARRPARTGRPA